ncbi:DNA ligase D [Sphingomonas sp.]|uniref:DNA ligase D n=1 Tax=Sphingomonas sp. TaxID=28214 RepID=UPI0025D0E0B5|nr:DNA ligase D [Sphingomonas sp.]
MARAPAKVKAKEAGSEAALSRYHAKRDFKKTAEPSGGTPSPTGNHFIVQKHAASRLHYDFRLEMDGVLWSWAVTRGPSLDPDDKRLAVRTEDHPLDYASFEGTIPKGEYGGGTVMLWDDGTWESLPGKDPRKTIVEGHLHFFLHGHRMKGEWLMIRLKPRGKEKSENWLLRKIADDHVGGSDDLVTRELTSVKTGRTMEEIAAGKVVAEPTKKRFPTAKPGKKLAKAPPFRAVQLATLVDAVPAGDRWVHEMKYDGYRTLISIGAGGGKAYTRSGLDWTDRFQGIVDDAATLAGSALFDGEAVVLDAIGKTSFQGLQAALKDDRSAIIYYAFDLLELDGEDLTKLPLLDRKVKLAQLVGGGTDRIRYSDHIVGKGEQLFSSFCEAGLEGVISKRADSPYSGSRSSSWLKTKCIKRQEFVIVGWLPSDKTRGFRSLLLGVNESDGMRYAGKAGTGFSSDEMEKLLQLMAPIEVPTATVKAPAAAVRGARWVKPKLVAEVAFTEFTAEGVLRHPSYIGLREDKRAEAVVLEKPVEISEQGVSPLKLKVNITNPDRVIFPESGQTKGQLADYYQAVSEIMLPWSGNRPISLVRCPQGRGKKCFFQKHDAGVFGQNVKQVAITERDGHQEPYLFVDNADGLLTCVQMGTIEFHGWGARIEDVEKADRLVFDLDPDEGLEFKDVIAAAFHMRDLLAEMGLVTFPMVTGGKGVHVITPLTPEAEWPGVKDFAHRFASAVAQSQPEKFTAALAKAKRTGRIFIDYLRNQRGATAVMPYSARARPAAPVAVPITWDELPRLKGAARWHIGDADELIERAGSKDLAGWGRADQKLPDL